MSHPFDKDCAHCLNVLVELYFKWIKDERPDVADQIEDILWPGRREARGVDDSTALEYFDHQIDRIWQLPRISSHSESWMWTCTCGYDPSTLRRRFLGERYAKMSYVSHVRHWARKREALEAMRCQACGSVDCKGQCIDDLDVEVVRLPCGCLSVNGQGHLPYKGQPCRRCPSCGLNATKIERLINRGDRFWHGDLVFCEGLSGLMTNNISKSLDTDPKHP